MLKKELLLAEQTAIKAGKFLKSCTDKKIISQDGKDIKLELDLRSEELIKTELKVCSTYAILGEEGGLNGTQSDLPLWIIDPIDGTMNYSRGIPSACVSIALWKGNEPLLGVIYDFNHDELFSAVVGCSKANSSSVDKSQAILATGFPSYMEHDSATLTKFIDSVKEYKKIRMIGSAALSLAYVSTGKFDTYIENSIKFWDVAAGIALCKAAGIECRYEFINDSYSMNVHCGV